MVRSLGSVPRLAAAVALLLGASLAASVRPASAQTVGGFVTDAVTGEPLAGVTLVLRNDRGVGVATTTTEEDGAFILGARSGGAHSLEVSRLGYAPIAPPLLGLERGEMMEVDVQLSRTPIPLDPITVTAVGRDPRHDASLEGMLVRRELYPSVGSRRVILRSDAPFVAAMRVRDVLRWVPREAACMSERCSCKIVYWNGRLVHNAMMADAWLNEYPADGIGAVEYYRTRLDAPLEYMDFPLYIRNPGPCSVIALWPRVTED